MDITFYAFGKFLDFDKNDFVDEGANDERIIFGLW